MLNLGLALCGPGDCPEGDSGMDSFPAAGHSSSSRGNLGHMRLYPWNSLHSLWPHWTVDMRIVVAWFGKIVWIVDKKYVGEEFFGYEFF